MKARWKQVLASGAAIATVAVGGAISASAATTPSVSVNPHAVSTIQKYLDSTSASVSSNSEQPNPSRSTVQLNVPRAKPGTSNAGQQRTRANVIADRLSDGVDTITNAAVNLVNPKSTQAPQAEQNSLSPTAGSVIRNAASGIVNAPSSVPQTQYTQNPQAVQTPIQQNMPVAQYTPATTSSQTTQPTQYVQTDNGAVPLGDTSQASQFEQTMETSRGSSQAQTPAA